MWLSFPFSSGRNTDVASSLPVVGDRMARTGEPRSGGKKQVSESSELELSLNCVMQRSYSTWSSVLITTKWVFSDYDFPVSLTFLNLPSFKRGANWASHFQSAVFVDDYFLLFYSSMLLLVFFQLSRHTYFFPSNRKGSGQLFLAFLQYNSRHINLFRTKLGKDDIQGRCENWINMCKCLTQCLA